MSSKLGAVALAAVAFLAVGASAAETGPLSDGKAAGVKEAASISASEYAPYLLLASLGAFAGIASSQGDGAISGCVGLPGCTPPTVTTTSTAGTTTTTTRTTATTTSTRTTATATTTTKTR